MGVVMWQLLIVFSWWVVAVIGIFIYVGLVISLGLVKIKSLKEIIR